MIPGSFCSPELLAHIVYEKYGKAVPLHRQEKDLASKHVPLLKATMSNWVGAAAEQLVVQQYSEWRIVDCDSVFDSGNRTSERDRCRALPDRSVLTVCRDNHSAF